MNKINVLQRGLSDCGPACLASVAAYYGLFVSVSDIQNHSQINRNGTTIHELISLAEKLGFIAKGVKGNIQSIKLIPKPFIAHLKLRNSGYHFVSIFDSDDTGLLMMDPALGKTRTIQHKEFQKEWTGVLVLLEPANCFRTGDLRSKSKSKVPFVFRLVLLALIALVSYSFWFLFLKSNI
ncbi:cysteine peptidase family C39 domain-containing protein [Daejeonella sp.]|jgi:ABC-type bacteriocin/lantibiotic exporter with double-glycine peptidase domain|uniref:cysteine peptidase family C39 domain-containing protein n=1 Tax=Daejeonella sp. TaxID=2805397 RepID=UPI003784DC17